MKYYFTLLLTLFFIKSQAARVTPSQFVEIASKQSMLSQKIAKSYILLTHDYTKYQKSLLDLKISVSYFNRNLETLKNYAVGNDKLTSAVDVQKLAWVDYSKALKKEKTPENAIKVLKLSEAVLKASNYVLTIGAKDFGKTLSSMDQASLVNVISKQSSLSQRLCLLFVNQKLKEKVDKKQRIGNESLIQTFAQMDDSLGFIISSSVNDKAGTEQLVGEASIEFDKLKETKKDFVDGKLEVTQVVAITESLTKLYDKLRYSYINLK